MTEHATRAKSALAGEWQPLGKWAMVKGEKTVAKYITNGQAIYVRFDGEKRIGQFETFVEAS
jgi:hypothetical protein